MTNHGAPRPAMAPCGAPRTRNRGVCQVLTPGGQACRDHQPGGAGAKLWTPELIGHLEELLGRGMTDREAGSRLGLTPSAIADARRRYGVARRDQVLMTTSHVAALLGCAQPTVAAWAQRGWLPGLHRRGRGGKPQWLFREAHLQRFLEDPRHWHRWQPADIPDAAWRAWAERLRGGVRFLTCDEAAARMSCSRWTIRHWVRSGRLTGYRAQQMLVREDELARVALPEIGQGTRKRAWRPCARCGDPDGKVPSRGRTPGRRDGRAWGYEGRLCETCYARLRAAAGKQREAA